MNNNKANFALTVLFLISIFLTIWEIEIYRQTVINFHTPLLIWLTTGLVLTPLMTKTLDNYYATKSVLLQLIFNAVTFGGIALFAFMSSNFYYETTELKTIQCQIINTGTLGKGLKGRCNQPYATVVVNGVKKQLIFNCETAINQFDRIELKLMPGRWGYSRIMKMTAKKLQ